MAHAGGRPTDYTPEQWERIKRLDARDKELDIAAREQAQLIRELSWGGNCFMYCPMPPIRKAKGVNINASSYS